MLSKALGDHRALARLTLDQMLALEQREVARALAAVPAQRCTAGVSALPRPEGIAPFGPALPEDCVSVRHDQRLEKRWRRSV